MGQTVGGPPPAANPPTGSPPGQLAESPRPGDVAGHKHASVKSQAKTPCAEKFRRKLIQMKVLSLFSIRRCGDGEIKGDEQCDLGPNNGQNNGCPANCTIQPGFVCPGNVCHANACGDGVIESQFGEQCDDGNSASGDGCAASCEEEPGYICIVVGVPCVKITFCGDGTIQPPETCDDGNGVGGDGCSGACHIEPNFVCPNPDSLVCRPSCVAMEKSAAQSDATTATRSPVMAAARPAWSRPAGCARPRASRAFPRCGDGEVRRRRRGEFALRLRQVAERGSAAHGGAGVLDGRQAVPSYSVRRPHIQADLARSEDANVPEPATSKSGRQRRGARSAPAFRRPRRSRGRRAHGEHERRVGHDPAAAPDLITRHGGSRSRCEVDLCYAAAEDGMPHEVRRVPCTTIAMLTARAIVVCSAGLARRRA